ncbi:MAG: putative ABC transport system permease protein [Oleiphilaceae bacterium]|jgi:putative ABC transport system permease protein
MSINSNNKLSGRNLISLSQRMLWRELKAGQLTIISLALILAVTVATVISVFSNRLDSGMLMKSTEILGADLRIRSTQEIPLLYTDYASELGLNTSTTLSFPSVVVAGDNMSLAAIKAVDSAYPLKGTVLISKDAFSEGYKVESGPKKGEVWLESRLLALLDIQVGEQVEVGRSLFTVSAVINQESDRGGNFYSLSPRLMMQLSDIEQAGLIQTGSRVNWRLLVASPTAWTPTLSKNVLNEFNDWLEPLLTISQAIESLSDNNQALSAALDKARQYLSLAAILAILLSGIAIAMAARNYALHHFDTSALLRTLGASQNQILKLFSLQLIYLALCCSIIGLILGTFAQGALITILSGLFQNELPSANASAWLLASITAPATLLGFALPHLLSLGKVSPLRVLRRELEPLNWSAWSIYSLAMLSIFGLSVWFTQNPLMSAILVIGGCVCLLLLVQVVKLFLRLLNRFIPIGHFSLYVRFAWKQVMKNPNQTATQVLAFSMILMIMLIISIVRNDLLADWQRALPDDAPNFFAMNIQEYEKVPYEASLRAAEFMPKPLFPLVPGRLTHINNNAVHEQEKLKEDPALQRDLALTWSENVPQGNDILSGKWHSNSDPKQLVSVESGLAKRLGISLDDELTFNVAGQSISVTVSSVRKVDWGTLTPNFYMILSASALEALPLSYITSFYIPLEKQDQLLSLIRDYPTITLLDMSMVFGQIQTLVNQVTMAVEYLLLLVLVAGLLVLSAALYSSLDERIHQGAILRTLGVSKANLRRKQWSEFAFLGLISGVIALLGAELISFSLYTFLLDLNYSMQAKLWLWVPVSSALLIMLLGAFATRKVSQQPPIVVLREL